MVSPDQAQIIAQISGLEPLAGAGLAINLAYLALDRFRYRQLIEPLAEAKCKSHDDENTVDNFHELDAVQELRWIARRKSHWIFRPKGKGAITYRYLFRKHQDVVFSVTASLVCAFTMVAGVALSIGRWNWVAPIGTAPIPGILFYACLLSLGVPAVVVMLGRKCVTWGANRIEYCTKQVAITLASSAATVQAPVKKPGDRQNLTPDQILRAWTTAVDLK